MAPFYPAGPYNGGYYTPYAAQGARPAVYGGGYSPNALPDLSSPTGAVLDANIAWYNSTIAPILDGAQNSLSIASGGAIPPAGNPYTQVQPGYPPGYFPQQGMYPQPPVNVGQHGEKQAENDGSKSSNSMTLDVGGFAAVGAGIGFFCGGGIVTAGIGAAIGGVVGFLKHTFLG
jgi:hypothetical protein